MRKLFTTLCAAALSTSFVAVSFAPAIAAPAFVPAAPAASSDVIKVQGRENWRQDFNRPGPPRIMRRNFRGPPGPPPRGDFYHNGHRGYRDYRPGYRRYNGLWFPGAAFITGAIIGGALANEGRVERRYSGDAHTSWCYDRYRSYRASDNTFQPYNGPRKQCRSPYG